MHLQSSVEGTLPGDVGVLLTTFSFTFPKCLTVTNINVVMMLLNLEKSILKGSKHSSVMFTVQMLQL